MEPELLAALLAVVAGGLPGAAARFLRRKRLTVEEPTDARDLQVSAEATLAEAAEIARGDGAEEILAVQERKAVGTMHVPQAAQPRRPREQHQHRFDITLADAVFGIAMIAGIAAKAVWDYENKYHKVGVNWLQINLALLVAPIVYIGVGSHLKLSANGTISLSGLAIAFQNGFFWQSVFSTLQEPSSAGTHPG